ncbi:hypothetical protein Q8W25_14240 [Shimia thalassica]|uniref:hypothetical protein n=1 Tax=Shimia thalassica TaxID=1715693 RepID=UPI002736AFD7|nr:hypothetical protein [Shimia thalassica]MDP2495186.1 hypothetical protein [Shimia thalassica]
MAPFSKEFIKQARFAAPLGALLLGGASATQAVSQQSTVPLHNHPTRIFSFETANMNPAGTIALDVGTIQTDPSGGVATGNQLYFGGGSYALNDRFSFGLDIHSYQDPTVDPINGSFPDFITHLGALWGKYQLYDSGRVAIAAQASIENFFTLESQLWGGKSNNVLAGSIKAPITFRASNQLQFHLTPSVSVFPDTVNGAQFYGTIASIGAGVSYKPSERLAFFGSVDTPVSGENTISNTATYESTPVWTVGGRYNVSPKVGLEGYVTNGVGYTPATSILTHWPDGDRVLAGLRLVYTPGANKPDTYRGTPNPVTQHQVNLQKDGFTLGSADVLEPGTFHFSAWGGQDSNAGGLLSFSPDRDFEIQLAFEQYSDNTTAPGGIVPTTKPRYMVGPKLRFMDQNNGDPFSLSARMLYGRQIESGVGGIGVFFVDLLGSYKANSRMTLNVSPKVATWGNTELAGLGLGLNYAVTEDLELIGEVTPVGMDNDEPTWAAGVRYNFGNSGFSVDANVSNAIGRFGIGTMIAQDDPRVTIALSKTFGTKGVKF